MPCTTALRLWRPPMDFGTCLTVTNGPDAFTVGGAGLKRNSDGDVGIQIEAGDA